MRPGSWQGMRGLDFTSWQSLAATLLGLALVTLIGMGIRLVMMMTIQQRRERMNRQINERLRVLIAAYKALGGSFTGTLTTDPTHLRDLLRRAEAGEVMDKEGVGTTGAVESSDRARRTRDAVEAALSDIILLGTEEHVRLACRAASELAAGKPVRTDALVVALRAFIREALDLAPIPTDVAIPPQGPARPVASGGRGKGESGVGGSKGGAGGGAMGMGSGMGVGVASGAVEIDTPSGHSS